MIFGQLLQFTPSPTLCNILLTILKRYSLAADVYTAVTYYQELLFCSQELLSSILGPESA